jgi:hypothetical protein
VTRCGAPQTKASVFFSFDSLEEIVGWFRLGKLAKSVIEGEFQNPVGAESVGFSHSDFGFVVEPFHRAAGDPARK